ncbi:uncharacterized protein LOC126783826 [Argentina anserina]|uniref:uncharacterized protein LOC126783826 n=1 Tax=Argentina anserina TaxID=57926 RepID=UPI0021768981|nr:uncharacterized protein LOC126783826 [Potentilla anserina]
MAYKSRMSRRKRMLDELNGNDHQPRHDNIAVDSRCYEHGDTSGTKNDTANFKCITMSEISENEIVQNSTSFGQAFYQRSRPARITNYHDSGDDAFECQHCRACFWLGEAQKHTRKKKPIYSNCCLQGQIRLPLVNSTPAYLEELLDPKNGRRSICFRENTILL